ncbi:hypothetical protein Csa_009973 [Cucumis sativus]|nr:hypothetical protein Csa_009973 [Cucumis sativus]
MALGGGGPQRGSAAATASMRRRRTTSSGTSGGAAGTMLQFYTDDAPGLKISPNVVLVMSIGFIAFVAVLHVMVRMKELFCPCLNFAFCVTRVLVILMHIKAYYNLQHDNHQSVESDLLWERR